jgi:D-alanine-D-alanine ligase
MSQPTNPPWTLRYDAVEDDRVQVHRIVEATGFFSPAEVDVAVELVDERLRRGDASGYYFVFAERDGTAAGYACYGPIAGTTASFDLFWIAVHPRWQGAGLGRLLLAESERLIARAGGRRVYIETSQRAQYVPTRSFYERGGYSLEAILKDFYAPGDDKAIFVKAF